MQTSKYKIAGKALQIELCLLKYECQALYRSDGRAISEKES